jgi:hypothetical protein
VVVGRTGAVLGGGVGVAAEDEGATEELEAIGVVHVVHGGEHLGRKQNGSLRCKVDGAVGEKNQKPTQGTRAKLGAGWNPWSTREHSEAKLPKEINEQGEHSGWRQRAGEGWTRVAGLGRPAERG